MLVVVEHRNVHALDQPGLDLEALRRLDVFEIDAAEGRLEPSDGLDERVDVGLGDLDVEYVDAGEALEQHGLAFHHRLGRERADIAEAEDRAAVADDAHAIRTAGDLRRRRRVVHDREAGLGDARRIGERQIVRRCHRFGGDDFELPRRIGAVIGERALLERHPRAFLAVR